jgi:hypothetical protein
LQLKGLVDVSAENLPLIFYFDVLVKIFGELSCDVLNEFLHSVTKIKKLAR